MYLPAGYGFVSFSDAVEGAKALREMDGKYIGNRPCKLRKSSWQVSRLLPYSWLGTAADGSVMLR